MGLEDVIFSDTESARDPRDGREETSVRVIKRDIVVTVGVVDGSWKHWMVAFSGWRRVIAL